MLIRYIGTKEAKRDNVNDPQTTYVWDASNGYVVDVKPEHVACLLKHPDVWAVEAPPKDEAPPKEAPPEGIPPKEALSKSVPMKGQAVASGK